MKNNNSFYNNRQRLKAIVCFLFILNTFNSFSQVADNYIQDDLSDYHAPEPTQQVAGTQFSHFGEVHTPQGELKVLLVFAQFEGDIVNNNDWPRDELPNYDNILYTDVNDFSLTNDDLSLSNFFYQMSKHSANPFKIYGEVFPELIIIPQPTTNYSFGHFTNQVFDSIEANYPHYNWSTFDNRENYPNFEFDNVSSSPDNEFDYVVITFRWAGQKMDPWSTNVNDTSLWYNYKRRWGNATGWSTIANQTMITDDGTYKVTHGFTYPKGLADAATFRLFFLHEFGHELYDAPHYNGANGVVGNHFYSNTGWGMMGVGHRTKYCALGWEQWWLGWNDIEYDLSGTSDNGIYYLYDFLSTGDMMRIKIPNTEQYLWLEFHSGNSIFEYRTRYLTTNDSESIPQNANGLLGYVECIEDNKNQVNLMWNKPKANGIKYLVGSGNYDYTHSSEPTFHQEYWSHLYNFEKIEDNPFSPHNGMTEIRSDFGIYNTSNKINYNSDDNDPNSSERNEMRYPIKNEGVLNYEPYGWQMNLVEGKNYSIYSNPAIIEHQFYNETSEELTPINLHGLKIELLAETSIYAKVKVTFDNNIVDESVRWTGNIQLPEGQTLTINNADVLINRSGTPSRESKDPEFGFLPYSYFALKNSSNLIVANYSHLTLEENSTMVVEPGAELDISDGILEIKSGCTLKIETGGSVNINDNGEIIIHPGGKLIYDGGNLAINSGGALIIDGSFIIGSDKDFKHNGRGTIVYNGSISGGSNSSFEIDGIGKTNEIFELKKTLTFNSMSKVKLRDTKIDLKNGYQIRFENSSTDVTIDNVLFTNSSSLRTYGVYLNNIDATIRNSTFEKAYYGLYSTGSSSKSALDIENCNFIDCDYGLYTSTRKHNIEDCNFEDCNYGWKANYQYGLSTLNDCEFRDNQNNGVYFKGYSGSELQVRRTTMTGNNNGIYCDGPLNVKLLNCVINSNNNAAVYVTNGTSVYLASGYGSNDLHGNNYAVFADDGNYIYLNNGHNDLRSSVKTIKGCFTGMTANAQANYNNWKSSAGSPTYGTDYFTYKSTCSSKLYLYDDNPLNGTTVPENPNDDPGPPKDKDPLDEVPYADHDFTTAELRSGTFSGSTLDDAIRQSLTGGLNKSASININRKVDLLSEILLYEFEDINPVEQWLIDFATNELKKELINLVENDEVRPQKAVQVYNYLISQTNKYHGNKKLRKLKYKLAKVDIFVISKKFEKALNILNRLANKADEDFAPIIEERTCEVNAEKAVENGEITPDMMEDFIYSCQHGAETKVAKIENESSIENSETEPDIEYLQIFPNPVKGISSIVSTVENKNGGNIKIYDLTGKEINNWVINSGTTRKVINSEEFGKGIYLVILIENGKIIGRQKLLVQ